MTDEIKTTAETAVTEGSEPKKKKGEWKSSKTYFIARLAILTAIVFVMAFTPLGYLKVGAIEITFLTIPVIIGAIWLGPTAGAILGGVFGITSFIQCFGMSALGAILLETNPIFCFIVCFFPRLIMGWLVAVIFKGISLIKALRFSAYTVSSFCGALFNTCFFMTALIGLYGQSELNSLLNLNFGSMSVLQFAAAFVGVNALVEIVVCTLIGMVISRILSTVDKRSIEKAKKRTEMEANELAAQNEQLKNEKENLSNENRALNENLNAAVEENKSLKDKLKATFDKDGNRRADFIDALDKDNNGKLDLFEKKGKKD